MMRCWRGFRGSEDREMGWVGVGDERQPAYREAGIEIRYNRQGV